MATQNGIDSESGTTGQVLQANTSAAPTYSTATYPSTTTINQILYSSAGNVVSGLATANNGVLITSGGGVPSISSTLPSAVQGNITSVGTIASGAWQGSVISSTYGGTGINNGGSTITVGGNTAFSGAFTFTGTLTANTAVTFPTSGTLSTTTGTVTSVSTSGLATGGPITGTGTVTVTAAVKSDQTTGTSTTVAVVPGVQQYHASAAKVWCMTSEAGVIAASYNVTSVTDNGAGDLTYNFTTNFSSGNYAVAPALNNAIGGTSATTYAINVATASQGANTIRTQTARVSDGTLTDMTNTMIACFGAQ